MQRWAVRRPTAWAFAIAIFSACGDPQPPPPPDPDQARECHPAGVDAGRRLDAGRSFGCAESEICVEGRCYAACTQDSECGPRERCASGACIAGGDAGTPDAGPIDPCLGVACTAPSVCHPLSGTCVACNEDTIAAGPEEPGYCAEPGTPVCDIAFGRCGAFPASQCSPCNAPTDCVVEGGFAGTCTMRSVQDIREQVCLTPCDPGGNCPQSLRCVLGSCVPLGDVPCATWRAGTTSAACNGDGDCSALGASRGFYPDACEGEVPAVEDGGVGTPGRCLQPCSQTSDCFDVALVCSGPPNRTFCRPP